MNQNFCASLIFSLASVPIATASATEALPETVRACAGIAGADARLACFDREVAPFLAPATSATTAPAPGNEPADAAMPNPAPAAESSEIREMTALVTEIGKTANGALIVTLDNGQIWQQKYASSSFRLREGDRLTIRKGNFGGYSMVGTRSRRSSQIRRVQ